MTRQVEISKWGKRWIAQLRVYDGKDSKGYAVTHDTVTGGKSGIPAVRRFCAKLGIKVVVID